MSNCDIAIEISERDRVENEIEIAGDSENTWTIQKFRSEISASSRDLNVANSDKATVRSLNREGVSAHFGRNEGDPAHEQAKYGSR
jgi:hypothetical protein